MQQHTKHILKHTHTQNTLTHTKHIEKSWTYQKHTKHIQHTKRILKTY